MINEAKIKLQKMMEDIRNHIKEYSNSKHEQSLWLKACSSQFVLWEEQLRQEGFVEDKLKKAEEK